MKKKNTKCIKRRFYETLLQNMEKKEVMVQDHTLDL